MKNLLISLSWFAPAIAGAGVITVTNQNLSRAGDTVILTDTLPSTTGIATGGYFDTGYDVSAGLTTAMSTGSFADFISNYNILTSDILGASGGSGVNGFFFASTDYGVPLLNPPVGAALYTFVGNGTSLSTSTAYALFSSTLAVDLDSPAPDTNDILVGSNTTTLLGTVGTSMVNFGSGPQSTPTVTLLNTIPEPSTFFLSALGVFGLLRRRR